MKGNEMKESLQTKLDSTKKFVRTHKIKIAAAAGVFAGVVVTLAVQKKFKEKPYEEMTLYIRRDHYNSLAKERGSIVVRDVNVRGTVYIRCDDTEETVADLK